MIRPRYSLMIDDMRAVQNNLEDTYANAQAGIESSAMSLYEKDPVKAKEFLTNYSCNDRFQDEVWFHLLPSFSQHRHYTSQSKIRPISSSYLLPIRLSCNYS